MLVIMKKTKQICSIMMIIKMLDQNEFSECFARLRVIGVCDVRVCYRLMAVVVKAMHTTSTHNILLESLLIDV